MTDEANEKQQLIQTIIEHLSDDDTLGWAIAVVKKDKNAMTSYRIPANSDKYLELLGAIFLNKHQITHYLPKPD